MNLIDTFYSLSITSLRQEIKRKVKHLIILKYLITQKDGTVLMTNCHL